jgi:hypothetical protein
MIAFSLFFSPLHSFSFISLGFSVADDRLRRRRFDRRLIGGGLETGGGGGQEEEAV